jgi:hypothetical protein
MIKMTNITLAIPEELHEKMKLHSEIRWSEVVRKSISQKVEMLDVMNKIASKSKLTQKDVDEISKKIKAETFNELNKK